MRYFLLLFLFISSIIYSQDIIQTIDNEIINGNITAIGERQIQYINNSTPDRSSTLNIDAITSIEYKNGKIEYFKNGSILENLPLEEVKKQLFESINNFAQDYKSASRTYKASFEGNLLRLVVMKSRGDIPFDEGQLWDFSVVHDLQPISYRNNNLAYLNIWLNIVKNEKKMKLDNAKLVIRLAEVDQAQYIMNLFRTYNALLARDGRF